MGFFDKMKRKLNVGGAKIKISSPGSLKRGSKFTLKATIKAGKIDQKVNEVRGMLQVETEETSRSTTEPGQTTTTSQTYVISEDRVKGFNLKAGETKEVTFNLKADAPVAGRRMGGTIWSPSQIMEHLEVRVELDIEGSVDSSDTLRVTM